MTAASCALDPHWSMVRRRWLRQSGTGSGCPGRPERVEQIARPTTTRYDKRADHYQAAPTIASLILWITL
jgi:hypothetical protein